MAADTSNPDTTPTTGSIVRLPHPETGARPIPKPIRFPSDYGLAGAILSLLRDYGPIGKVNRLIEAAEAIEAGDNPLAMVGRTRRVELAEGYPMERDAKRRSK